MKIFIISLFVSSVILYGCKTEDQNTVSSPDNNIALTINTEEGLNYSVLYKNYQVIASSKIEFEFQNAPTLGKDMEIIGVKNQSIDHTWKPILKRYDTIRNYYNEMIIQLKESRFPERRIDVEVRAYNDGIAFRTVFLPRDTGFLWTIMNENTEFNFAEDHECWAVDYGSFDSHQESEFKHVMISDITDKMYTGLPLTIKMGERRYCAITEAALINYAGTYLKPASANDETLGLKTALAPRDGQKENGVKVIFKGNHKTPWRVIMLGNTPGALVESEIVQNLNEPCKIKNTSWIKPGISAWDHWWSGEVKMEQDVIIEYIDLASRMGWEYMLIDWQWYGQFDLPDADITTPAPQLDMPAILQYAEDKNVKCWLWLYWTDVDNADFDSACNLYHDWGIAGVKIDFMARDDQQMVNWYHNVVKTAAKHQLMVDFHGAYKPTGWRRTYPNLMTREGVLGNEYNKWSYRITPDHNCTLPFTRMLAGPMDFTPGGFLNANPDKFRTGTPAMVQGSRTHTLAQFVIYDSPFLVACDHPKHYKEQTGNGFLQEVPSVWDDTKVLNGEIGEYISMARRDGENWFIGVMNNSEPRKLTLSLNFIDSGKRYTLVSYSDTPETADNATIAQKKIKETIRGDHIRVDMVAGGGYVAYLKPID